ncbi:MAG: hypothetical protein AAB420_02895 [Patescibacteria group bacterium]
MAFGSKIRIGFVIGAVAAASWAVFSWFAGSIPGVIANVVRHKDSSILAKGKMELTN